jgi:hypothetical protein
MATTPKTWVVRDTWQLDTKTNKWRRRVRKARALLNAKEALAWEQAGIKIKRKPTDPPIKTIAWVWNGTKYVSLTDPTSPFKLP